MGERNPRVQGVIRLLRAVGPDPAKALSALAQIVTGRAPARAADRGHDRRPVAVEGPRVHRFEGRRVMGIGAEIPAR